MTRNQKRMMEWLGAKEDGTVDEKDCLTIVEEMGDFICGTLCTRITEEEKKNEATLPSECFECEMGEFACRLLNHDEFMKDVIENELAKATQILEKKRVICTECRYCHFVKRTGKSFCMLDTGIRGVLKPGDGCSRGKKKVNK